MTPEQKWQNEFDAWLATRPECIQKLAREFPVPMVIQMDGQDFYLLGYNENDVLMLSTINPAIDYEGALRERTYLCAQHVRDIGQRQVRL